MKVMPLNKSYCNYNESQGTRLASKIETKSLDLANQYKNMTSNFEVIFLYWLASLSFNYQVGEPIKRPFCIC